MTHRTNVVAEYVAEVARLAKTGKATEHSFRGALAALFDALAPGLKAVNEPKRTDCGAPDYIVQDRTGLAVFYVEAKDLGDGDLDGKKRTGHKEQFDRYKAALDTIIFTDYLDFRLYRHDQFVSAVRIADLGGPPSSAAAARVDARPPVRIVPLPENYDGLAQLVADAAAGEPQRIDGAKRLAELMAGKARMLQSSALKFLKPLAEAWDGAKNGERPQRTPLLDMMLDMRKMLMPEVGAEVFSDIFAQTLTYGMFAARLNDPTPEDFSRAEAMMLIPKSNPFLKKLFGFIAADLEDELTWIVDDLADLFRAANVADIMRDYGKAQGGGVPARTAFCRRGRQAPRPHRLQAVHPDGGIPEDRSGAQAARAFQDARIVGDRVVAVVGRMRVPRPRIRRLLVLREIPRQDGGEARAVLQRLGEDREGEGKVRLHVARRPDSPCRVGWRQAVDLPLLRQPRLQVRP